MKKTSISDLKVGKISRQLNDIIPQVNRPFVYNLDNGLPTWRENYKNIKNMSVPLDVNIVGDSICEGVGATPNQRNNGFVGMMRDYFNNKFTNVGGGYIPTFHAYDTKVINFVGTWDAPDYGVTGMSKHSATTDSYLEFTMDGTAAEFFVVTAAGGGAHEVQVDGSVYGTLNTYSSTVLKQKLTISGLSDGQHLVRVTIKNAKDLYLEGIRWIKGSYGVRLNMCARFGTQTSSATTANSRNAIQRLLPKLTILAYVANDAGNQVTLSSYATNINTLITDAKLTGDVIIVGNGLHNPNSTPLAEKSYLEILLGMAIKYNCVFVDINKAWGTDGFTANLLGYLSDAVHPNNNGHSYIRDALISIIES